MMDTYFALLNEAQRRTFTLNLIELHNAGTIIDQDTRIRAALLMVMDNEPIQKLLATEDMLAYFRRIDNVAAMGAHPKQAIDHDETGTKPWSNRRMKQIRNGVAVVGMVFVGALLVVSLICGKD